MFSMKVTSSAECQAGEGRRDTLLAAAMRQPAHARGPQANDPHIPDPGKLHAYGGLSITLAEKAMSLLSGSHLDGCHNYL